MTTPFFNSIFLNKKTDLHSWSVTLLAPVGKRVHMILTFITSATFIPIFQKLICKPFQFTRGID